MAATKYLDYDGLLYFWGKLKAYFAKKATTLSGYGITDAKIASGTITLGSNTITPLTSSSSLSASKITGQVAVAHGGSGLSASPSMLTDLGSSTAADVMQASPRPGVTGVLAIANGGTGHGAQLVESTASDFNSYIESGDYHVGFPSGTANAPMASDSKLDCVLIVRKIGASASVSSASRYTQIAIVQRATTSNQVKVFIRKGYSDSGNWTAWSEIVLSEALESYIATLKVNNTALTVSSNTVSIPNASTSAYGCTKLSSATNSTSTSLAATASAVKAAYDLANGKQSPATTLAGYGITDAYTKTEIDTKLTSAMHYKGSVATVAQLPSSGNQTGDFYNVTATGENYAWTGSAWDVTGSIVDLAAITNSEIDTVVAS